MNVWIYDMKLLEKPPPQGHRKLESDSNYQESILVINNAFGCLTVKFNESSIN